MGRRLSQQEADARFRAHELEPLEPYQTTSAERRCRCVRCGTTRWVKLATLGKTRMLGLPLVSRLGHWLPWSEEVRAQTAPWRTIDTSAQRSLAKVERLGLIAITPPSDEFTPIGFLCPRAARLASPSPTNRGR